MMHFYVFRNSSALAFPRYLFKMPWTSAVFMTQSVNKARLMYTSAVSDDNIKLRTRVVDLRSDTVTKPNSAMRQAMFEAEVGDDVYGEDRTITLLQQNMAALLEMEAGLFVPSGTMGNMISVMVHCSTRGSEAFLGDLSHIMLYEQGAMAQIAGVHPRSLTNKPDGTFSLEEMVSKVRIDDPHEPVTSLICIENTQNSCGGKVLPLAWLDELGDTAEKLNLPIHVDGARLMNAAVKLKVPPSRLLRKCSSCSICLSKGLGAPVGSVIVGSHQFIAKALRMRKVLGGGMRQVGILGAAGLVAIETMVQRLEEDHVNARKISEAITQSKSANITVNPENVDTNILNFTVNPRLVTPDCFCDRMAKVTDLEVSDLGEATAVLMLPISQSEVRLVTHCDINQSDIEAVMKKFKYVIKELESV